ncbi:MAG: NAD-dependent epimerase/dehydratase family protein [Actinomycetota bacterium]
MSTRRPLHHPVVLGAGPVGRGVAARLIDQGAAPTVLTRSGTVVAGADAMPVDITDPIALRAALTTADADAVFQCAMPPYHRWPQEFPALQAAVVEACTATEAVLVAAENLYAYGVHGQILTEDGALTPTTVKGRVRAELWRSLASAHTEGRIRAVAVRASDFFGPGVAASSFGHSVFGRLADGKAAQVFGDPDTRHSVTYVPDYAAALVRVAERPDTWGQAWFAPTAPARTQAELVRAAAHHLGVEPRIQTIGRLPLRLAGLFNPAAREMVEMLPEFTSDFVMDSSMSEKELELAPTDLDAAIAATAATYR